MNCNNTNGSFYCSCATGLELYDKFKCRGKNARSVKNRNQINFAYIKKIDIFVPPPNKQTIKSMQVYALLYSVKSAYAQAK